MGSDVLLNPVFISTSEVKALNRENSLSDIVKLSSSTTGKNHIQTVIGNSHRKILKAALRTAYTRHIFQDMKTHSRR